MSNDWFHVFIPWASLLAGLGGGLHCVGMCGGLVAASCDRPREIMLYQLGRGIGYLLLGGTALLLGSAINLTKLGPWFLALSSLMIGGLFIFWGIRSWQGKRAELPLPHVLSEAYQFLYRLISKNSRIRDASSLKSFAIGFLSILLPCGLLYGVILGLVATLDVAQALIGILFFWLGTLPAMVLAPGIIQKLMNPLKKKWPRFVAISLISMGVLTIAHRFHEQLTPTSKPCPKCHPQQNN
jgi:sulfite exporter TauE/SafE